VAFGPSVASKNDYRLQQDSPAVGKGGVLPKELFDPLRPAGDAKPGRVVFPLTGDGTP